VRSADSLSLVGALSTDWLIVPGWTGVIGDSGLKILRWTSAKQVTNSIGLKYAHRLAVPQTPCLLLQAHDVVSNPDNFGMIASGKKKRILCIRQAFMFSWGVLDGSDLTRLSPGQELPSMLFLAGNNCVGRIFASLAKP
jgi:hypothetical protein